MRDRQDEGPEPRSRSATAQAVTIALLVVGLLTAIFVIQNTSDTEVNFLFWAATIPLAAALLLAAVLGGTIAFLVAYVRRRAVVKRLTSGRGRSRRREEPSQPRGSAMHPSGGREEPPGITES